MQWEQDLIRDIRTNSLHDDSDWAPHPTGYNGERGEVTAENRQYLTERFLRIRDNCPTVLEIGVCRNHGDSITHRFLQNKKQETIYFGIDIDDKSFLNNLEQNIFTIRASSSDFDKNMAIMKSHGVKEFGFIFIDGWHSINQVLDDWEYTQYLAPSGIVGFHDTSGHPGPKEFVAALDRNKWVVEENLTPSDYGIGFAWKK